MPGRKKYGISKWRNRHSGSWDVNHYDLNWRLFDSDAKLLSHLQAVFKRMEDDGWSETERSRTRRIFRKHGDKRDKFWEVSLKGSTVYAGYSLPKEYPSREKAVDMYERMIAEKLVEWYVEHNPRETEFSQLGFELAKKKAAAPKKVRKVRETSAAENIAKVLGKPLENRI